MRVNPALDSSSTLPLRLQCILGWKASSGTGHSLLVSTHVCSLFNHRDVIISDVKTKTQRCIPCSELLPNCRIVKFCLSGDGSLLAVVACNLENKNFVLATINVRKSELGKTATVEGIPEINENFPLFNSEENSKMHPRISFSSDHKTLAACIPLLDGKYHVTRWNICPSESDATSTEEIQLEISGALLDIKFHPTDSSTICVGGDSDFHVLKSSNEESARKISKQKFLLEEKCISFSWVDANHRSLLAFSSGAGDMFIHDEKGKLLLRLHCEHGSVHKLIGVPGGFAVLTENHCSLYKFSINDEDKSQCSIVWSIDRGHPGSTCCDLRSSLDGTSLDILSLDSVMIQLSVVPLRASGDEGTKLDYGNLDAYMINTLDKGGVVDISLAVSMPLLVVVTDCNWIRIWNYITAELITELQLSAKALSVALHPSGLYMLVGFDNGLRCMQVLKGPVEEPSIELSTKQCGLCRFSRGGALFAAADESLVAVYGFLSRSVVCELVGHKSKVTDMVWKSFDEMIVTCDEGGTIFQWNTESGQLLCEIVLMNSSPNLSLQCDNKDDIWASGKGNYFYHLAASDLSLQTHGQSRVNGEKSVMGCWKNSMTFFVSSSAEENSGSMWSVGSHSEEKILDIQSFSTPVLFATFTSDQSYLILTHENGNFSVYGLANTADRTEAPGYEAHELIRKSQRDEQQKLQERLQKSIEKAFIESSHSITGQENLTAEKIKIVFNEQNDRRAHFSIQQNKLNEEKERISSRNSDETARQKLEFETCILDMEQRHQRELFELAEVYQLAVQERSTLRKEWRIAQQALSSECERSASCLNLKLAQALEEDKKLRTQQEERNEDLNKTVHQMRDQFEDDLNNEMVSLRQEFDTRLIAERDSIWSYTGKNGVLKKKSQLLMQKIEETKENTRILVENEKWLHEHVASLKRDLNDQGRKLDLSKDNLLEKEKVIVNLKISNQSLECKKDGLIEKRTKLSNLDSQKQENCGLMATEIGNLKDQAEVWSKRSAKLEKNISKTLLQIDQQQEDVDRCRRKLHHRVSNYDNLMYLFRLCRDLVQQPDKLLEAFERLHQHIGDTSGLSCANDKVIEGYDDSGEEELQELEKLFAELKSKHDKALKQKMDTTAQLQATNLQLIREIREIRETLV